jgi:hypothetical protein
MAANNKSLKSKPEKSKLVNQLEPQPRTTSADEKSLRAIRSLTGYLGIAVLFNALVLGIQLWATFKAGYILTAFSFVYLFLSLSSIGALIWCIILLNRKSALALWACTGFIAISFLSTLAVRSYGGKALFAPLDFVGYIVQAAILFSIHWLKRKDILI